MKENCLHHIISYFSFQFTGHFFSWILYWYSTRASNFDFLYHSSIYINIIVFWELNHDIARVPRTIVQAQCMCKQCLVRKDEDYLKARMPDYECRPVYFYERVLRRVDCDNNNVYIYRTVIEKIKVGCTCAIPLIVRHSSF
jgi:hypothetical protein